MNLGCPNRLISNDLGRPLANHDRLCLTASGSHQTIRPFFFHLRNPFGFGGITFFSLMNDYAIPDTQWRRVGCHATPGQLRKFAADSHLLDFEHRLFDGRRARS